MTIQNELYLILSTENIVQTKKENEFSYKRKCYMHLAPANFKSVCILIRFDEELKV